MTQEPHPLRCETCKIPKNQTFPKWCPVIEAWVGKNFPREVGWVIDKVGCASHSSAASGREQVLLELEQKITQAEEEGFNGVLIEGLYEWVVELRKQGGEQ